jgi:hypothetical protein
MTDPLMTDAEKAAAYAKTVGADAVKDATVVQADVQKVKTEAVAVENKLTTWIKAHASAVAIGLLVIAALVVWHLI